MFQRKLKRSLFGLTFRKIRTSSKYNSEKTLSLYKYCLDIPEHLIVEWN